MTADQGMSLVWLSSSTCNPYSCTVSLPVLKMMVPCARSMPTSTYSSSVALPGWVLTRTAIGLTSSSDRSLSVWFGCRMVATLPRDKFEDPAIAGSSNLAGGGGFEPPLTGSEPVVLPLDDPPAEPFSIISDER